MKGNREDVVERGPKRIWLEPECCVSPYEGRQWCEDNVWPADAASCDAQGVEYVRADLYRSLLEETEENVELVARSIAAVEFSYAETATDAEVAATVERRWFEYEGAALAAMQSIRERVGK